MPLALLSELGIPGPVQGMLEAGVPLAGPLLCATPAYQLLIGLL